MKNLYIVVLLLVCDSAYAGIFGYDNFHECILENMPGAKSNHSVRGIYNNCKKEFSPLERIEKSQSFFGVQTANECITKYSQNMTSQIGANWIKTSCNMLY